MKIRWPRAVLFDLDGTLADTTPDLAAAIDQTMAGLGLAACGPERVRGWVGNGMEMLVERALGWCLGEPADEAGIRRAVVLFSDHYRRINGRGSRLYPGVRTGLDALRQSGVSLACVTNKPAQFTHALLDTLALDRYFRVVLGGDSLAEKKPHPEPVFAAMRLLNTEPCDALFVGDSLVDLEAARNAGILMAFAGYGYHRGADPGRLSPDYRIDSIADLPGLVAPAQKKL